MTFYASCFYWHYTMLVAGFIYNFPLFLKMNFYYVVWWLLVQFCEDGEISVWTNYLIKAERKYLISKRIFFEELSKFITGDKSMITLEEVGDRIEYIPEAERGDDIDNPTKFYFEKKRREEIARKRDELIEVEDGGVNKFRSSTVAYKVTLDQLCDWENVCNSEGQTIPFEEDKKEELYDRLPVSIQNELEGEFSGGVAAQEEKQAQEE